MASVNEIMEKKVVFRKFKDGEIIALFPYIIANSCGDCDSYMHVGQHSAADYSAVINTTKLATEEEYKDLLNELKSIGYNHLSVIKKKKR